MNDRKKTLKSKIKQKIQDRIQQIRSSYPYSDLSKLPGLSVSQLAGSPNDAYSKSPANYEDNTSIITDLNKLALF